MGTFAETLGLRDATRERLEPTPEADVDLYVDVDGLLPTATRHFVARAPKLVVIGDYGAGKTHLLHVLMNLAPANRLHTVYLKLEPYGRVAESRHLHRQIILTLDAAGLMPACVRGARRANDLDTDVRHAFDVLHFRPTDPTARAWLQTEGLTANQARKAGFSGRLFDLTRAVGYSQIWRALARGLREETGRELVIFVDESETFQEIVDPIRAVDLGVAVREMVDRGNEDFGVVIGLAAPKDTIARNHPLLRPDVYSRVQDAMLYLGGMGTPERRRAFLEQLLPRLFNDPGRFLTPDALDELVARPIDPRQQRMMHRDPVQRDLVKRLDAIARRAVHDHLPLPLDGVRVLA